MSKENKKQIKAQVINEVQRLYKQKFNAYEEKIEHLTSLFDKEQSCNIELRKKVDHLEHENMDLTNKVEQYELWIERMMDFCNLPDNERQTAFKTYLDEIKSKDAANKAFEQVGKFFNSYMSIFN